jgi:hypothetical protein
MLYWSFLCTEMISSLDDVRTKMGGVPSMRRMNKGGVGMELSPAAALAVLSFSHRSQSECSGQPNYTLSLLGSRPQENAFFSAPLLWYNIRNLGILLMLHYYPIASARGHAHTHTHTHTHTHRPVHTHIHKNFSVDLFTIPRCFTTF